MMPRVPYTPDDFWIALARALIVLCWISFVMIVLAMSVDAVLGWING
jgi:hypothetical protein